MTDQKFNVLLYSDGSYQAFSAAVYTANLFKNIPDMHLTVVHIVGNVEGSAETEYHWIDTWPVSPTSEWMKRVLNKSDATTRSYYQKILTKTNQIFAARGQDVSHHALYSNTKISDTSAIEDALIDYATKNSTELIIMGTRGLSALNGLIFGSLAHNVLDKSPVPVLLIKKLPQAFIDSYLSDTES
ncbi:MAG TPA: universal stress protein [Desulfosporosinus sp.]